MACVYMSVRKRGQAQPSEIAPTFLGEVTWKQCGIVLAVAQPACSNINNNSPTKLSLPRSSGRISPYVCVLHINLIFSPIYILHKQCHPAQAVSVLMLHKREASCVVTKTTRRRYTLQVQQGDLVMPCQPQ